MFKSQHKSFTRYLAQVAEAYQAYTSGCSSIQQRDVVNYINYVFEEYISDCEHNYVEFQFELVLNVDIYISIAKSQLDFQQAIQIAFQENSQEVHKMILLLSLY